MSLFYKEVDKTDLPNFVYDFGKDFVLDLDAPVTQLVVNSHNTPIGYGYIKPVVEAVAILNPIANRLEKTRALDMLMQAVLLFCQQNRVPDLYMLTKDPRFSRFLQRHYGLRVAPELLHHLRF